MTPAAKGLLDESTSGAIVVSEDQHCEGKFNSLSLTVANESIFLYSSTSYLFLHISYAD